MQYIRILQAFCAIWIACHTKPAQAQAFQTNLNKLSQNISSTFSHLRQHVARTILSDNNITPPEPEHTQDPYTQFESTKNEAIRIIQNLELDEDAKTYLCNNPEHHPVKKILESALTFTDSDIEAVINNNYFASFMEKYISQAKNVAANLINAMQNKTSDILHDATCIQEAIKPSRTATIYGDSTNLITLALMNIDQTRLQNQMYNFWRRLFSYLPAHIWKEGEGLEPILVFYNKAQYLEAFTVSLFQAVLNISSPLTTATKISYIQTILSFPFYPRKLKEDRESKLQKHLENLNVLITQLCAGEEITVDRLVLNKEATPEFLLAQSLDEIEEVISVANIQPQVFAILDTLKQHTIIETKHLAPHTVSQQEEDIPTSTLLTQYYVLEHFNQLYETLNYLRHTIHHLQQSTT